MTDLSGRTIAEHYRFDVCLGEGTFAKVYRVHDTRRNVNLAAKVLRVDIGQEPAFLERFRREGHVLARLQHPNIVRYYDLIETDDIAFILMDYVPGETLQATLYKLGRPLQPREAYEFLRPLTAALHFAHGEGIIHRDLKPGNILMHENGNLLVTDFGIARLLNDASFISTLGHALGTPLYMAPEQITSSDIIPATDVYSLGVILFQMLSGTVPFSGKHPSAVGNTTPERVTYEHLHVGPPSLRSFEPSIPETVEDVVMRCLAKDPRQRWDTTLAVYDAMAEALGVVPTPPQESVAPPVAARLPELSQYVRQAQEASKVASPLSEPTISPDRRVATDERPTAPKNPLQDRTSQHQRLATPTMVGIPSPPPSASATPRPARATPPIAAVQRRFPNMTAIAIIGAALVGMACLALAAYALSPRSTPEETDIPRLASVTSGTGPTMTFSASPTPTTPPGGETPVILPTSIITLVPLKDASVAYASHRTGNLNIFVTNADGETGRLQITTDSDSNQTGPAWSPDGGRIAFYGYDEIGGNADIFVMNSDGSDVVNLTNSPDADDRYVAWSPDGHRLVFHSDRPSNIDDDRDYELYIYDLRDDSLTQVTSNDISDLGPDWSPDGALIAFHSYSGGKAGIYTIKPDGTERQLITPNGLGNAYFPTWSPDGKRLAFHVDEGNHFQIYIINVDGTGLRPLMHVSVDDRFPDWSPDGTYVIFQRLFEEVDGIYRYSFLDEKAVPLGPALGDRLPDWRPTGP